ncbi:ABC transporter ATP-binding protein [Thermodesulfobacteriota bacterium]
MLKLQEIEAYYGIIPALKGINIEVQDGEFVCLLGPNGAGKSTTVKSIMGILKPESGKIILDDQEITGLPPHRTVSMGLSLVPEDRLLFPEMTVRENLDLGASTSDARAKLAESLEHVFTLFPKLKTRETQAAGTFSGGEQQMLAIGRALMSRPRLLLLDEPSLGLAPIVIKELFQRLKELNEMGIGILLVEQNAIQALKISQRAYVIESGKIVSEGSSAEFAQSEVIKSYIGL